MRHRRVWLVVVAVGLGIGAAGITSGQEPASGSTAGGNTAGGSTTSVNPWFGRFVSRGAPSSVSRNAETKDNKISPVMKPVITRAQAQADFLRRLEVCDKLREIAFQNGDGELMHKVEQLEQRVEDAYAHQTRRASDSRAAAEGRP
jgi:hypothetical protein